jgi:outer membrane protein
VLGTGTPARAEPEAERQAPARVLQLADALRIARAQQPVLRRARADAQLAEARLEQARAPLWPQLTGSASYQRTTGNFVPRPGQIPRTLPGAMGSGAGIRRDSFDLYNFYVFGVAATQLLYDFGASTGTVRANRELARAQAFGTTAVARDMTSEVSAAFLQARAYQELVVVARENLTNSERHLEQAHSFVRAGTRPEIDLYQVRTDVANARVGLIEAENTYAIGKAALERAMGSEEVGPYALAEEALPALPEEDQAPSQLYRAALEARPELAAFEHRAHAQRLLIRANKGGYGPALNVSTNLIASGIELDELITNWNAGLLLVWPVFQGGVTRARVAEARAAELAVLADRDAARLSVRFEVEQARLGVHAAKAAEQASHEAVVNAEERLKLAEKRYEAGVGNAIELADARVALAAARAQAVHAAYALGVTRVLLRKALGGRD